MAASTEPQASILPARAQALGSKDYVPRMKKLIVGCDGTWDNGDQGLEKADALDWDPKNPQLAKPTNVTRILRCLSQMDEKFTHQIAYYQSGVGTHDLLDKVVGGLAGLGLSEHIREAYHFLAQNYDHDAKDEIYLVGFSRGSFTARSIAAFISDVGLLTPKGMMSFYPIFNDWENQQKEKGSWKPFPSLPWDGAPEGRPNLYDDKEAYVEQLVNRKMTRPGVKVQVVACFDTVGSLGLPRIGIFGKFSKRPAHLDIDYSFVDTKVPPNVIHAIHALALDEERSPFIPTLWETPRPDQTLTQVWFPGAHCDVGGSYEDTRQADITLTWMISQLSEYLAFNEEVLNMQYWSPKPESPLRGWAQGKITNSLTTIYHLVTGHTMRTPMEYKRVDHQTGEEDPLEPLVGTNERIHASVRLRMGKHGKGLNDEGSYNPPSLGEWTCTGVGAVGNKPNYTEIGQGGDASGKALKSLQEAQRKIVWTKVLQEPKREPIRLEMAEEPMSLLEWKLLARFEPSVVDDFLTTVPK